MKIALLDCHNKHYELIAKLCNPSKVNYCEINGYDFITENFDCIEPYGATWARIFALEKHIKKYDWVFYLDTDVIITNPQIKIEDFIDYKHHIYIGRMPDFETGILNHISTSAIIMDKSDWAFNFLSVWKSQKLFITEPYWANDEHADLSTLGVGGLFFEQSAFHYLYDHNLDVREKTKLVDGLNDRECTHKKDSFLIHFARSPKEKRIKDFLRKKIKL